MHKYELAVVVSAAIEDDERAAVVEKCKDTPLYNITKSEIYQEKEKLY